MRSKRYVRIALPALALLACDGGVRPTSVPTGGSGGSAGSAGSTQAVLGADAAIIVVARDAAPSASPMPTVDPTVDPDDPAVAAFGGRPPELPLLAADGARVALDLSRGLGESGVRSYEVGVVDKTGKQLEHLTVVELKLALAILEAGSPPDGQAAPVIPKAQLAAAAARVTKRLAGFTPFAFHVDYDAIAQATTEGTTGKLAVGATTLAITNHEDRDVELQWLGADGKPRRTERVPHRKRQYSDREGGRCGGQPRLDGVWWDAPRDRLLLRVDFLGSDTCTDEPTLWMVW